jgi:hypothetical protein
MGRNDLSNRLQEGLGRSRRTWCGSTTTFPVTDPAHVVYTCMVPNGEVYGEPGYSYPGYDYPQYERAFSLEERRHSHDTTGARPSSLGLPMGARCRSAAGRIPTQ